jgi:tRNA dimethylallyltransferase
LRINAEIVTIDSATVYRGLDIGTDKPTFEDLARVRHHLVDVVDPSTTLSVAEFQKLARDAIDDVSGRGVNPLLVGGSGLYFRAVVDPLEFPGTDREVRAELELEAVEAGPAALYERLTELDPEAAGRIDPANARRTIRALEVIKLTGRRFSSFRTGWDDYRSIYDLKVAGISWPRAEMDRRIDERVDSYVAKGLVEEVKALETAGLRDSLTSVQALGYAQLLKYLDGEISLDRAIEEIKRRTRRFARRQLTWFRADPRVRWFESDPDGAVRFLLEANGDG